MRIVSLKEDFAFKEFMSNEIVRKFFLAATLNDFTDKMELHIIELRKYFDPEDNLSDWVKLLFDKERTAGRFKTCCRGCQISKRVAG